ncbi:GNAT family N-acetyltransferase [Pelosinus sp. sgz500959]|uniref:GNAT family N-acetyltransferase n=1 Tax=Pelosinus sp. sgz500959 TaxID=3242472 RepID=UPI0036709BCE
MRIELVEEFDLDFLQSLVQLEAEAFGIGGLNEWHLVPFIRHGQVYIAKEQEKVVGLIQYMRDWKNPNKAYLMGVSIAKKLRGQGLGTILMRTSLRALKEENIEAVELTVDPKNFSAIKIYQEKLGFVGKDRRVDEYGAGENRLVMLLSLCDLSQD